MREGDDITSHLVLATLADPHYETQGCETAKHLLHLRDAVQDAFKFVRDDAGVRVVFDAVAVAGMLRGGE